jgi:hypothetical protein
MKKKSLSFWPRLRLLLAVLLSMTGFALGLGWGLSQTPSWAAPGQNPYMQTVPTRLPTSTPTPVPTSVPGVQPVEDEEDTSSPPLPASPTRLPVGEYIPAPTSTKPAAVVETVAAPQPDYAAPTPPATIAAKPSSTDETGRPVASPTLASVAVDRPEQPPESWLPLRRASLLLCLCPIGLGLLLVLGGIFLLKHRKDRQ